MTASIQQLVLDILTLEPNLTNDQVADRIQGQVPGSTTSAASVSSIKSGLKKKGLLQASTSIRPALAATVQHELDDESDEDRSDRIRRRYRTLERMSTRVAEGGLPAIIVSGPPGLGKSYTVEQVLRDAQLSDAGLAADEAERELIKELGGAGYFDTICGTITAPGLYLTLYNMREGGVVVLDDCDDVFRDETCLNLLKAVLDSSETRRVSYRKRASWMEEEGIPTTFEFKGSIVFCTNIDFELAIAKGSAMAPHFAALIDRSLYLSLTMRTTKDFITRIRHVAIEDGMLTRAGLTQEQAVEVMDFVEENASRFYSLSLRLVHQIGICFLADEENWKDDVLATKMRTF
jgi:hypothetical protein